MVNSNCFFPCLNNINYTLTIPKFPTSLKTSLVKSRIFNTIKKFYFIGYQFCIFFFGKLQ